MPHDHPVTNLLVLHHHKKEGIFGINHVVVDMKTEFWIIEVHSAVEKELKLRRHVLVLESESGKAADS